jgi:hypothetical protein
MTRLKLGETLWDQALAKELYDQNMSFADIARSIVGVKDSQISAFAARHWPSRDEGLVRMLHRVRHPRPPPRPRTAARKLQPGETTLDPLPSLDGS